MKVHWDAGDWTSDVGVYNLAPTIDTCGTSLVDLKPKEPDSGSPCDYHVRDMLHTVMTASNIGYINNKSKSFGELRSGYLSLENGRDVFDVKKIQKLRPLGEQHNCFTFYYDDNLSPTNISSITTLCTNDEDLRDIWYLAIQEAKLCEVYGIRSIAPNPGPDVAEECYAECESSIKENGTDGMDGCISEFFQKQEIPEKKLKRAEERCYALLNEFIESGVSSVKTTKDDEGDESKEEKNMKIFVQKEQDGYPKVSHINILN